MNMFKKIFSLVLVIVLLFNLSGYFWIFKYNQVLIRSQVREWIRSGNAGSREEIVVLSFPLNSHEFKWIDKKEFIYKGKLYDVISRKITGNAIIFHCINDKKEQALFSEYKTLFSNQIPGEANGKANNTKAMLSHLIKQALLKGSFCLVVPYQVIDEHSCLISKESVCLNPPPSPPPEA